MSPPNFYAPPPHSVAGVAEGGAEKSLGLCKHGSAKIRHSWVISTAFSTTPKQSRPGSHGQNDLYPSQTSTGLQGTWKVGNRCKVLGKPGAGSLGWAWGS